MLHLRRVQLRRAQRLVLDHLDLDFTPGTITVVVGPSGVGKSSLLAALNGLLSPAAGRIWSDPVGSLDSAAAWREQRRRTATVFQEPALIDRLSVIDNVLLGLAEQRHPLTLTPWPKASWLSAARALEQVGLLSLAHTRADKLSGGERQRVGLARALVRQPMLLLGDEPLSAVDPARVAEIGALLRHMADQGCTLILVMHQLETAFKLADRIIGLAGGAVAYDGSPSQCDDLTLRRIFYAAACRVA